MTQKSRWSATTMVHPTSSSKVTSSVRWFVPAAVVVWLATCVGPARGFLLVPRTATPAKFAKHSFIRQGQPHGGCHIPLQLAWNDAPPQEESLSSDRTARGKQEEQHQPLRDIYLVPWDGCLMHQTNRHRALGLQAAISVWPELQVLTRHADLSWLVNKLDALQHVLGPPVLDPNYPYHPAVEYAMAIRLLLEEQELDEGNSNGSTGKYGSKFHPSANDTAYSDFEQPAQGQRRRRRQRPLTVGEIAVNWKDTLREAAWIRYAREEGGDENPLELLHQAILEHDLVSSYNNPNDGQSSSSSVAEDQPPPNGAWTLADPTLEALLRASSSPVIVGVYHESDLAAAKASIRQHLTTNDNDEDDTGPPRVVVQCDDMTEAVRQVGNGHLPLVCLESSSSSYHSLLQHAPDQCTVHILESYWSRLQDLVGPLFGDHIPRRLPPKEDEEDSAATTKRRRRTNGLSGSSVVPGRFLELCLCEWASHPNGISSATMNAWTTTVTTREWLEELQVVQGALPSAAVSQNQNALDPAGTSRR